MPDVPPMDIAAVVVLYRPDATVTDNIAACAEQVDTIFAVDNSERPDAAFIATLDRCPGVCYIANGANQGIAAAMNVGARAARDAGFAWLLTMDQDSTVTAGMVERLRACALAGPDRIGLVSPVHRQVGAERQAVPSGCHEVLTAMSSGNLVNLDALADVGGFMEELFIDQVDHELCLRLWDSGYRVLEAGDADLIHRVGYIRRHTFPFRAYSSNHSALRRYYMTRNRLWVARMYRDTHPEFGRLQRATILKDIAKITLWEDHKGRKLAMMWRGARDYRARRLGAYGASTDS